MNVDTIFELSKMSFFEVWQMVQILSDCGTEHALKHENVQNLIKDNTLEFDLILAEQFYEVSFLMFAHKYKAPIVTVCK